MNETPRVSSSCAPIESSGTSIASETDGPRSAPAPTKTSIRGSRRSRRRARRTSPAPSMIAIVRMTSLTVMGRIVTGGRAPRMRRGFPHHGRAVFLLLGSSRAIPLLLALAVALYLTVIELREMSRTTPGGSGGCCSSSSHTSSGTSCFAPTLHRHRSEAERAGLGTAPSGAGRDPRRGARRCAPRLEELRVDQPM